MRVLVRLLRRALNRACRILGRASHFTRQKMPDDLHPPSPSALADELHDITDDEACALVDAQLGAPETWDPELVKWRLDHESQRDWKAEVGHWLNTAQKHGFLEPLVERSRKRGNRVHKKYVGQRHPNEKSHLDLAAELAPAMAVHYFTHLGWGFGAWEPKTPLGDVDVELVTPSGRPSMVQVKSPDQPGVVVGGRINDGDYDGRVLEAIEHGRVQLLGATDQTMIVVSAHRRFSAAARPDFAVTRLLGPTHGVDGLIVLSRKDLGLFLAPTSAAEWSHIGAVVFLDYLRGADRLLYTCTVLLNPEAGERVRCDRAWFPRARVCWFDGERFHWQGGEPARSVGIHEGTPIVDPWW